MLAKVAHAINPALCERAAAILAALPPTDLATAIVDWGDCSVGGPAIDLAIGWSLVPWLRAAASSPKVTPATWARARHGIAILAWGRDLGDPAIALRESVDRARWQSRKKFGEDVNPRGT